MGLFLPNRNVRHKKFDYEPRYYDPKKDDKIRQRMRIQRLTGKRRNTSGIIYFVILFAMALYVYMKMG
jgi:hypothetical protein